MSFTNWKEAIDSRLLSEGAHMSHDQSNITEADRFSEEIKKLSKSPEDRHELLGCVIDLFEAQISQDRSLQIINYVLESLKPMTYEEKDRIGDMIILGCHPKNPSARGYLLRFLVSDGFIVNWDEFLHTRNWTLICTDHFLAADILVYAGRYDEALRLVFKSLRTANVKKSDAMKMAGRWKDRFPSVKGKRKREFADFLVALQTRKLLE